MIDRHGEPTRSLLRIAVAIAIVGAIVGVGRAADPPALGGGLVPTPRKTREERVREWDLNSDGKIDQGEAEIASSRMRRERAELRLNSGIDPVTGLPRGEAPSPIDPGDADLAVEPAEPEDEPAEEPEPDERPTLPRSRVPRPTAPAPGGAAAAPQANGSRAAANLKRQALTGGVKAGALPARAGYGPGVPSAPLNAGLPIPPKPRAAAPATAARGGLVPTPRVPAPRTPPPASPASRSRDMYDPY